MVETFKNKFNIKHKQPKNKSNSLKEIAMLSKSNCQQSKKSIIKELERLKRQDLAAPI